MQTNKKKHSVKYYIAVAVFMETTVNALFSLLFHHSVRFFYADYAHLTVWGDIVSIISVIISFVIYDCFAHRAYKELKSRLMFLGIVYVASKAASIVHYLMAVAASFLTAEVGDAVHSTVAIIISVLEVAVDVIAAIWLMGYFDKKLLKEKNT